MNTILLISVKECPSRNEIFYSRSRHAKILTAPVKQEYIGIFRGLKSEHNPRGIGFALHRASAEVGQKSH